MCASTWYPFLGKGCAFLVVYETAASCEAEVQACYLRLGMVQGDMDGYHVDEGQT